MKCFGILLLAALATCSPITDDALKKQAARSCGLPIKQITLRHVERDPKTRKPTAIASAGEGNRCLNAWKSRNGIMQMDY